MNEQELKNSLATAIKRLNMSEPYYAILLMMINKYFSSKDSATAGVFLEDINMALTINPEYWQTLSDDQKLGVLTHEMLHCVFFHLTQFDDLEDKDLKNIAMDLEVNQYIDSFMLPKGAIVLDMFKELNLDPKAGCIYYYNKLKQESDGGCQNSDTLKNLLDAAASGKSECKTGDGRSVNVPDHKSLKDEHGDQITETHKKLIESQLKHCMEEASEVCASRGTVPQHIADIIKSFRITKPQYNWRKLIRKFIGGSEEVFTKTSSRKYNKRIPQFMGMRFINMSTILLAVDTSGSVNHQQLKSFLNEMYNIKKMGQDVEVIQCDTEVKSDPVKLKRNQDFKVFGRGGTDYQPVIDYFNANRRKYSCLVYFTDGECPAPENVLRENRVLWCICNDNYNIERSDLPGIKIQIKEVY